MFMTPPKTIYRQQQPTRLGPLFQTPSVNGLGHSASSTLSLATTHHNFLSYAHCLNWPVLLLTPLSPTRFLTKLPLWVTDIYTYTAYLMELNSQDHGWITPRYGNSGTGRLPSGQLASLSGQLTTHLPSEPRLVNEAHDPCVPGFLR